MGLTFLMSDVSECLLLWVNDNGAQGETIQPFPLEFPILREGVTGVRKGVEAVHL